MSKVAAIAVGAISGFGSGNDAFQIGCAGDAPRSAIAPDEELAAAGLRSAASARAPLAPDGTDRASQLLLNALDQLIAQLDEVQVGWREQRLGLCVGTSSGGMCSAEEFFRRRAQGQPIDAALAERATYFAPFQAAVERLGVPLRKRSQVVAACASSTLALGLAKRWLESAECDLVVAGGYDALSLFVAAGFEGIRATSRDRPQPFRQHRDGMLLGEGAALVALVREPLARPLFFVSGFGASADAVHITAPDREGRGLVRAARSALEDASLSPESVGLISAHGTSTPYNDAAEAKAIAALCAHAPPVHAFKAQIGHTLGAAGILEVLAAADGLRRQLVPATWGQGELDPDAAVSLPTCVEAKPIEAALKLSAAFGGVTASLLLEAPGVEASESQAGPETPVVAPRGVRLVHYSHVTSVDRQALALATGMALDRIARIDDLGQLALAATAKLASEVGREQLAGAGIVGGYSLATLDTNERFYERLLRKGPRWVDPRLFPATSPNAGVGHCGIAYQLTGPNLAVCAGLDGGLEALQVGATLIRAGDAERMVVVAAEDAGPAAQAWMALVAPGRRAGAGALAALLEVAPAGQGFQLADLPSEPSGPVGHLGLLRALAAIA